MKQPQLGLFTPDSTPVVDTTASTPSPDLEINRDTPPNAAPEAAPETDTDSHDSNNL